MDIMKLLHLSDLHLGKSLIDVSMLDDQAYILDQIAGIAAAEKPDAVLIAGDVYDRSNPSAEAMALFGDFVHNLATLGCKVMAISGNHDSADRVAYMGALLRDSGVYVSPVYDGHIEPVTLRDEYGPVDFFLMPFIHPEAARKYFKDAEIANANDAARLVIGAMRVEPARRNVMLSHQCVLGSTFDEHEQRCVGTLDNVDPAVYDPFDYVALGHIHRAQSIRRETLRYCGTPLKYSKKEALNDKSVTRVVLGKKGDIRIDEIPLKPRREVRLAQGMFEDLRKKGPAVGMEDDYYFITLTDDIAIKNVAARLRERFPNLLAVDFDNSRTRSGGSVALNSADADERRPMDLLSELYRMAQGRDMSDEARAFAESVIAEMEGFEG